MRTSCVVLAAALISISGSAASGKLRSSHQLHRKSPVLLASHGWRHADLPDQDAKQLPKKVGADVARDAKTTLHKARNMDPRQMVINDVKLALGYMMPGKRPDLNNKVYELILAAIAIMWFMFYKTFIYQNDREPELTRWCAGKKDPSIPNLKDTIESKNVFLSDVRPDVVLVFQNPGYEHADRETEVPISAIHTLLANKIKSYPMEKTSMLGYDDEYSPSLSMNIARSGKSFARRVSRAVRTPTGMSVQDDVITIQQVRTAILQDIYSELPSVGFDVTIHSSVERDELFLCISLQDERAIQHHLARSSMKLQLNRTVIATRLEIDQPPEEPESSPPYVRYDVRLATNLFGDGAKDLQVYQKYAGKRIMTGANRIRIITNTLNDMFHLDFAVRQQFMRRWYPAHNPKRVRMLNHCWAKWGLLRDLSCVQPIQLINEYFSSRIAFSFAWAGLYCKFLLALVPVSLVFVGINIMARTAGTNGYWNRGSVLGLSVAVFVWARITANMWKSEEQYFSKLWDLSHGLKDASHHPDFVGELAQSKVDASQRDMVYPAWKYGLRQLAAWTVTVSFCGCVFMIILLWLDLFGGRVSLVASVVQAIMIQIFTLIFNWMAETLTIAENHKFQTAFYNSYLGKMFIFQMVNQYSTFLYIAVKQQFTEKKCPDNDCVGTLQIQLPMTLAVLVVMRIVTVVLATMQVWFKLWLEERRLKEANKDAKVTRSYVEKQSKFGTFRTREQIEVMTQLCLSMGYVVIFGGAVPATVPLCFLVFLVQLRAGGVLVTTAVNRPVPRRTVGLGPWLRIMSFLVDFGVVFTGYLLVNFGPMFVGTAILTKTTGLFLYYVFVRLCWVLVDIVVPPNCASAELLEDRREHVIKKLTEVNEDAVWSKIHSFEDSPRDDATNSRSILQRALSAHCESTVTVKFADQVEAGQWSDIPQFAPGEEKVSSRYR